MLLSIHNLRKRFTSAGLDVVAGISFGVEEGEIFALLGPSGCGKTTTLRLLGGFEHADAGRITLGSQILADIGVHVQPERRGIGIVFQDYALFPHLTVLQNTMFGLRKLPKKVRRDEAMAALQLVGLSGFADRYPHALSGGQQQRVAIARALAPRPRLILLDEPFSNLDALLRQQTRHELRALLKEAGMTALLVTHDQEEALSFADRVAVMRDGNIEQVGTPEAVYTTPRTLFVAQFLGRTNLLLCEADGTEASTPLGPVQLNRTAHGSVLLSLRPEHLTLIAPCDDVPCPTGVVVAREFKGHDITFRVAIEQVEYLVHTHSRLPYQPGDAVRLQALEPAVVLERETV